MLKWLWGKNGWDGCWGMVLGCVVAFFVLVAMIVGLGVKNHWWGSALAKRGLPDHGVPVMEITLADGLELSEIDGGSKDVKYEGNEVDIYNNGGVAKYGDVEMKGRGNGSWLQEKKPYQIKFDEKVNLFGMGKARKWYLLANSLDDTFLRTDVAVKLEEMLEMEHIYDGEFVELYVGGDYRGLYYLTRAVEIDKNKLDLRDPMGILVELDNIYGWMDENYTSDNGDLFVIKDVVEEESQAVAMENFMSQYNKLERAIEERDFETISELIDVNSFAQYYLLSEFSVNPDAYWTSFYMYKDGVNDKIHAGPGWDFDLAFCNKRWGNYWLGDQFYSPRETMVRSHEKEIPKEFFDVEGIEGGYEAGLKLSRLIFDLMKVPEFRNEVSRMFQERMSGRGRELIDEIELKAERIDAAVEFDNTKWETWGFETEFTNMIEWIQARYDYFEEIYGSGDTIKTEAI